MDLPLGGLQHTSRFVGKARGIECKARNIGGGTGAIGRCESESCTFSMINKGVLFSLWRFAWDMSAVAAGPAVSKSAGVSVLGRRAVHVCGRTVFKPAKLLVVSCRREAPLHVRESTWQMVPNELRQEINANNNYAQLRNVGRIANTSQNNVFQMIRLRIDEPMGTKLTNNSASYCHYDGRVS